MTPNNHPTKLAVVIALGLAINFSVLANAQALSVSLTKSIPENWQPKDYEPDDDLGAPGMREGGATRGKCEALEQTHKPIIALEPKSTFISTISPYPTLIWYWPYTSNTSDQVSIQFALRDKEDNPIYSKEIAVPPTPGIVSMDFSTFQKDLPPLEVGKVYHWQLTTMCNSETLTGNSVDGWIERFQPNPALTSKIQHATPLERAYLYAEAGIWSEAAKTLLDLRRTNPNDPTVVDAWAKLLKSVGLNKIAQEAPIAQ